MDITRQYFTCKKCGESKIWGEFPKYKECKDGIWKCCKKCNNKEYMNRYHKNPLPVSRASKKWAQKNKDRVRESNTKWQRESPKRKTYIQNYELLNKYRRDEARRSRLANYYNAVLRERSQLRRNEVDDSYSKHLLRTKGFSPEFIRGNADLVNIQRTILQIKRLCKTSSN